MSEHTTGPEGHDPNLPDPDVAESLRRSNPNATGPDGLEGGMGSSSEWVGHVGSGRESTDGLRDTSPVAPPADAPPEQSAGGEEPHPADPDGSDASTR